MRFCVFGFEYRRYTVAYCYYCSIFHLYHPAMSAWKKIVIKGAFDRQDFCWSDFIHKWVYIRTTAEYKFRLNTRSVRWLEFLSPDRPQDFWDALRPPTCPMSRPSVYAFLPVIVHKPIIRPNIAFSLLLDSSKWSKNELLFFVPVSGYSTLFHLTT